MSYDEPAIPAVRWRPHDRAYPVHLHGPTRVDTSSPNPNHKPRPVGFTARLGVTLHDAVAAARSMHNQPEPASPPARCSECGDVGGHHFRVCSRHDPYDVA